MDVFDRYYVFMSKEDQFCFAGHQGNKSPEYDIIHTYFGEQGYYDATLRAEEYNVRNGFIDIVAMLEKIKNKYKFIYAINKDKELTKDEFVEVMHNPNIKISCFSAIWEVS
jgi:hypothetical protein